MNRPFLINSVLMVAALVLAGCATLKGGSLQKETAYLEDQTREFYSEIRAKEKGKEASELSRATEALILSSRDLSRAVERRATNQQVLTEFDRVARDYKNLSQQLSDGRNADHVDKFQALTHAYQEVEESLSSRQAAEARISMTPAQVQTYTEIEKRTKLKDYWFP